MKLAKALYFIAFLLAINVFVPGFNNYVEAKPANANGNSLAQKIKNNKVAFLATLMTTLALAAAGTTFGVMHLKKKGKGSKSPSDKSKPLYTPRPAPNAGEPASKPAPANAPKA